jgi:formylglycine-generating enzyme required for sulfatase activity
MKFLPKQRACVSALVTLAAACTDGGGETGGAASGNKALPTVKIVLANDATHLSGTVVIGAAVDDDIGVVHVEFKVDGKVIADDTVAPFKATWDTKGVAEGAHDVEAIAFDTAGGKASAKQSVTVDHKAPQLAITAPDDGKLVEGVVTVTATASDGNAVARVTFAVGAEGSKDEPKSLGEATAAPFEAKWDTAGAASGKYVITAAARDKAGNETKATRTVTLDRKPVVAIEAPVAGKPVADIVTIVGSASDDLGLQGGEIQVDGAPLASVGEAAMNLPGQSDKAVKFGFPWDTTKLAFGDHTIKASFTDKAGQTTAVEVKVLIDQPLFVQLLFCPSAALEGCIVGTKQAVAGTVYLLAKALDDNSKAKSVAFTVDGKEVAKADKEPFTTAWDSTTVQDGKHTIAAVVTTDGGATLAAQWEVDVSNCDLDKDGWPGNSGKCKGADCNDGDPTVFPGAPDAGGDGKDSNCDGIDGIDGDQDGYASIATGGKDCNDSDKTVYPCADDLPGDKIDSNCDGKDALSCDDCLACTEDQVDGAKCKHSSIGDGGPCSDGNACTLKDSCKSGACVGADPLKCDDGLSCTVDACDPVGGCSYTANAALCLTGDKPCVAVACDPDKGCVVNPVPVGAACKGGVCNAKGECGTLPPPPVGMQSVPGGTFKMGCVKGDTGCYVNEEPQHEVTVNALLVDKTEVTVKAYGECVKAGKCTPTKDMWGTFKLKNCNQDVPGKENHPINCVDWIQADAYCKFVGKRLPSAAEWEYSARGGLEGKLYPWGDAEGCEFAVWKSANATNQPGCDGTGTLPVGSKPKGMNGFGLYDMAGNLCEWVNDWYDGDYYAKSPKNNPQGPSTGTFRENRGGTYFYTAEGLRASLRFHDVPEQFFDGLGFRCVKSAN